MQKELQAELPCRRYSLPTLSIEKENKTMTDYPNNIPAKLEIIKASEITPERGALAVVSPSARSHCCKTTPETARVS